MMNQETLSKKTSVLWTVIAVLVVINAILTFRLIRLSSTNAKTDDSQLSLEQEKLDSNDITILIDKFIAYQNSPVPYNFPKYIPGMKIKDKSPLIVFSGILSAAGQTISINRYDEIEPSDVRLYGPNAGVSMIEIVISVDENGENADVMSHLKNKYGLTLISEESGFGQTVSQYKSETDYTFIDVFYSGGNTGYDGESIYVTNEEMDIERVLSENAVTSDDSDEPQNTESISGSNWDAVIDEYELLIDKYIALMKKAKSGDMNVLTEYASYMEKVEALSEKISAAESEMTKAQMTRYLQVTQKMASAASNL